LIRRIPGPLDATEKKASRYFSGIEPRFVGHPFRTFVTLRH